MQINVGTYVYVCIDMLSIKAVQQANAWYILQTYNDTASAKASMAAIN